MLAIPLGIAWTALTPPMRVPDEGSHFLRVEQVVHGGVLGAAELPSSVVALARDGDRDARRLRSGRDGGWTRERLAARAATPLDADVRESFDGGRAAGYAPVPYLPAVVALVLLRPLELRPLTALYVARVAQLAGAIALVWAALRAMPFLAWASCLLALAPTAAFLRSGVSADSLTSALALLVFALAARPLVRPSPVPVLEVVALGAASLGLALAKSVYLPLTLTVLAWPRTAFGSPRRRAAVLVACVAVPWLAGVLWLAAIGGGGGDGQAIAATFRADPAQQLALLVREPLRFVAAVAATWGDLAAVAALANGAVGRLGLLDVALSPGWTVLWLGGAVLLALCADGGRAHVPAAARAVFVVAALGCLAAISLVAWLEWSPPGSGTLFGLQGRYLLPLAPYALLAPPTVAAARRWCPDRAAAIGVAVLGASGNVAGLVALARHDWAG